MDLLHPIFLHITVSGKKYVDFVVHSTVPFVVGKNNMTVYPSRIEDAFPRLEIL